MGMLIVLHELAIFDEIACAVIVENLTPALRGVKVVRTHDAFSICL